jgi:hypothetical protein
MLEAADCQGQACLNRLAAKNRDEAGSVACQTRSRQRESVRRRQMQNPPENFDGARVLRFTSLAKAQPTGKARHVVGGAEVTAFAAPAIMRDGARTAKRLSLLVRRTLVRDHRHLA